MRGICAVVVANVIFYRASAHSTIYLRRLSGRGTSKQKWDPTDGRPIKTGSWRECNTEKNEGLIKAPSQLSQVYDFKGQILHLYVSLVRIGIDGKVRVRMKRFLGIAVQYGL